VRKALAIRARRGPVAVVLDMRACGLGIARSLGRKGIPVVGLDFPGRYAPGLQSRYCLPFLSPHPERESQRLLGFLVKLAEVLPEKTVLYPASEPYVRFVSRFRRELEVHFLFAIPSRDIIDSVWDKRKQYDLARRVGVAYPETWSLENMDQLREARDQIEYPAFIKPCYSKGAWNERYADVKGFKVRNQEELTGLWRRLSAENLRVFVQSIVRGPDSNVFEAWAYMSKDGVPLSTFVTQKLRQYPVMFGNATCMVSVHDEEVLRFALKFFRGIDYRGLGFIEIKKDDRDGKNKLIELNPRLSLQNILATHAGLNFPLIQYMDLAGSPIGQKVDYKDGVKWLDATNDLLAFIALFRCGRLSVDSWFGSIADIACHAYFAHDDLKPFLGQYAHRLVRVPRRLVRRLSMERSIPSGPICDVTELSEGSRRIRPK
jgi:predicted ATP-grasp superfamily ATP-dependent carboligase